MGIFCCENRYNCTLFAVIASAVIGIIAAFLNITAVISVAPVFLWALFGVAVVYLGVLVAMGLLFRRNEVCSECRAPLSALLSGILGTVLFSVILLAITFAATSVIGAIFVGLLVFFFALTITSAVCLVKCLLQ